MAIDLVGERFERLTVVRRHGTVGEGASWYCVCDCGTVMVTRSQSLRKGGTRSCGCLMRENNGARLRKMYLRHGKSGTSIHNVWLTMRARCENPRSEKYPYYGARGIKVCERWQTFENFLADMGERPSPKHSIDRKDNDGNYEPGNCRWATAMEQARNKRRCGTALMGAA